MRTMTWQRVLSFTLALVMVLGMAPSGVIRFPEAKAASVTTSTVAGGKLGLSAVGTGNWTVSGDNQIVGDTGQANGQTYTTTLTITNVTSLALDVTFTIAPSDAKNCNYSNGTYTERLASQGTINISLQSKPGASIIIGYIGADNDKVTISNISAVEVIEERTVEVISTDGGSVTYNATGEAVSGVVTKPLGTTIGLKANPDAGYVFSAWVDGDGKLVSTKNPYEYSWMENTKLKAVFVPADTPTFHVVSTGMVYHDLDDAVAGCATQDTIILLRDGTIRDAAYTIPSGVTLLVPYSESNYNIGNVDGYNNANMAFYPSKTEPSTDHKFPEVDAAFRTLTLGDNVTLTVNGRLCIGGQIAAASGGGGSGGQTAGAFCKLVLNDGSKVLVQEGGILSSTGYIVGDGTVEVHKGTVYQPFIMVDFNGGSYSAVTSKQLKLASYIRYAMLNIQSPLVLHTNEGAKMYGYCNLFGGGIAGTTSQHNPTLQLIVGSSGALVTANGEVEFLYDGSKTLTRQGGSNNIEDHIGKTTINLNLGAGGTGSLGSMTMTFSGQSVNTQELTFGVPYNVSINLNSGTFNLGNKLKVLPGSELYVAEGATLNVNSTLLIYDGLTERQYSNSIYPNGSNLAKHYLERGRLIVDGTLNINSNGTFAGLIESTGNTGVIKVAEGATLSTISIEGVLKSDKYEAMLGLVTLSVTTTTRTTRTLTAQIYDGNGIVNLTAGENYYASQATYNQDGSLKSGYTYNSHNDNDVATELTVAYVGDTTMYGMWRTEFVVTLDPNGGTLDSLDSTTFPVDYESDRYADALPTPTAPTGYDFAGWFRGDIQVFADSVPAKGDHTLTAKWTPKSYNLTYNTNGGTLSATGTTVTYTETYGELPTPTAPTGYSFEGWYLGNTKITANTVVSTASDHEIVAHWRINKYTITFANTGDTVINSITQDYGTAVTAPADPTRTGYQFAGWDQKVPETMPANNLTLNAQWTPNSYTVSFNANGGSACNSITVTFNSKYDNLPAPTRTGYDFGGWYSEETLTNRVTAETVYTIAGDTTLYAKWTPVTYTIQYELGGGQVDGTNPGVYTIESDGFTLINPTRTGYTFAGWTWAGQTEPVMNVTVEQGSYGDMTYTANWTPNADTPYVVEHYWQDLNGGYTLYETENLTGTTDASVTPGVKSYLGFSAPATQTVTINADGTTVVRYEYTRNSYTITFESNDGSEREYTQIFTYGDGAKLNVNAFDYAGYHFVGWSTGADNETEYGAEAVVNDEFVKLATDGKITLYAAWEINTYHVVYDANGGTGEIAGQRFTHGDSVVVLPNRFARTGYSFTGWNTAKDGSGTAYSGQIISAAMTNQSHEETLTLYAQWKANTYTVTFDANGGTACDSITVTFDSAYGALPTPTKTGYDFVGWYLDDTKVESTDKVSTASDHTLTAKWLPAANAYTVVYYTMDTNGEYILTDTQTIDGVVTEQAVSVTPEVPEGFTLDAEKSVLSGTVAADSSTVLKVYYSRNRYTVTWDVDGVKSTETYYYGAVITMKADLSKEGHTFAGWTPEVPATMGAGNVTYTATWTVNNYTVTWIVDGDKAEETHAYGEAIVKPQDPSKAGYTFTGWGLEVPADMPAENLTFTAQWTANTDTTYTVEHYWMDLNGNYPETTTETSTGSGTTDTDTDWSKNAKSAEGFTVDETKTANVNIDGNGNAVLEIYYARIQYTVTWKVGGAADEVDTYYYGAQITRPEEPIKEGYTFRYWYAGNDDAVEAEIPGAMPAENLTFTAKWIPICYTVTFHFDEGLDAESYTQTFHYDQGTTMVPRRFNREGYAFVGWKDSNGTSYDDQAYVFNWTTAKGTNFDLYAQWDADSINYTVEYYLQNVDGNGYTKDETHTKTLTADMDSQTAVDAALAGQIEGFTFERADNITISVGENNVVKVYYTRNPYTVTWDVDGTKTTGTYLYGAEIALPVAPTKLGYTFAVWQGYTSGMTMPAEHVTFAATWIPDEYAITYELDGGVVDGTNPVVYTIESESFTLSNPTKTGYTFAGWTWEGKDEPVLNVAVEQGSYGHRTYTAKWTVNQYTITFVLGNGEDDIILTQDYGTEVIAPENPAKTGYAFAGWDTEVPATMGAVNLAINAQWIANTNTPYKVEHHLMDVDGQGYTLIETENLNGTTDAEIAPAVKNYEGFTAPTTQTVIILPDGSLVVRYDYTRNQYDLTWKYDDGVTGDKIDQDIYFGAEIQMPEIPSWTGYTFAGWYYGDTKVEALTMPAANVTLTAKWTARSYEVAFHANGGTVNPISKTVTFDSAYGALPTPIRAGYVFAGWYTAAEGGTEVTAATVVKDATVGGHTLYARWTPGITSYTIIHWQQNVADDEYTEVNRQTIGNAVTEDTTAAEAWIFTGFTPQAIQQQTIAGDGSTVVHIYYDRNVHTLAWNTNGGVLSGEYTSGQVRYGTTIMVPEVSRNGYTFVNWGAAVAFTMPDYDLSYTADWTLIPYTITYEGIDGAQNGNPTGYNVETETFALAEPTKTGYTFLGWTWEGQTEPEKTVTMEQGSTGDRTYTAHWEANAYTVIFHANGGEGTMENQSLVWDDARKPLPDNIYTRKGYTFLGWALTNDATAAKYGNGEAVSNLVSQGSVTLYAVWSLDAYTIGYTLNGGVVAVPNPNSYTVETDSFTLAKPTRTGYTFLGWTVNGGTEKLTEVTIEKGTTGNLQFEAHWQINTYTITFHSNGGDAVDPVSRTYQGQVLASEVTKPGKEGHTFVAWYLDEALTKPVTYPVTMTADLNFYAKWTVNQYTITFMDTGDTVIDPIIQDYGTAVTAPADPVRKGYTFAGWDVEIPDTMPGSNVTITALWTVNQYTITFANTGDTVIDSITQDYGTAVTAPTDPVRKGYTFAGWDQAIPGTMPAQNVIITALWTINQYSVTFDSNGGATINPIKQNYLTQIADLPDAVRAGYRFDGWFYADGTQVVLPITLEEHITVVAHWTSYLELLMAIDPADFANAEDGGEDREILTQAREYFNLMKLNSEQLTKYQGAEEPYASHWDALEVEIREVALMEMEHSIEGQETLDKVNNLLTDNGKASATLDADPETNYVDIWIEDPERKASDFLTIPFLTALLNNQDIWSIHFPAMEGETDNEHRPVTPYGSGVDSLEQLELMIRVAYATINTPEITGDETKKTYNYFFDWLYEGKTKVNDEEVLVRNVLDIGVLDGKGVTIEVNAKTPEGVEFGTTYVLSFCNRTHDVTWDVDGETVQETYAYGDTIVKPADPAKEGHTFTGWEGYTEGMTMGKTDVTFRATWSVNSYDVTWNVDGDTTVVSYEYGAVIRLPEPPVKEGHSFTGWSGYIDGMTMPAHSVTFTAVWDVLEFTVTFNSDGGTEMESVTQDYGTQVNEPTAPEKTGYTFEGWYNGDTQVEFPLTMPVGGLELKAKWTPNQFTVTLDAAGGTVETETLTVTYGQPYGLPTPTREGYTFDGWFHNGVLVSANVDITDDATFVAQWTLGNPYNISYDLGDGRWADGTSPRVQYTVETDSFTLPQPGREGYTFAGWIGTDLAQPTKEVTVTKGSTGDRSYTATWTINQYTITFVQGNGQTDIVLTQDYGTAVTAPADPTREGYTFGGWNQTVPGTMPAENLVITAKWTINQYTITFVQGNGEENIVMKQDYGTAVTAPADPTREGYTFLGWDKEIPGTMPSGDVTITALWEINVYTITFNTAGGTAVEAIQDVYGAHITVPADPTREGYTFAGWDVEIPETMPAGNMTITAKWTVNTYTLTYLVDGEVYKTFRLNYGVVVVLEQEPTKTGYTFSGWDQTAMLMPAHDVQISGTFTPNTYIVHFNANYPAAPAVDDMTVTFDSAYGTLPVVERTGYTFTGWTLDGVTVTAETLAKTAGEHTLVAQWTPNTYKVTLVLGGGECDVTQITVTYDGTYLDLPVPTREGYDFLGWFDGETQVLSSAKVTITADQTLTARWKASGNTPYTVEHYQQALDGTYVLVLTENLTGAADTLTQAQQKSYSGFHVNASMGVTSGMIAVDGSLVLKLYYDRDSYDVVWNVAGKQIRETYVYGQTLNVPDPAWAEDIHARYDFIGWDQELPETASESATYTAQYSLYYEASIDSVTYRTLALALENAKPGETVRLARDVTVTENLTVPKDVLLLIPCKDDDNGYDKKYDGRLQFNYDSQTANGVASLYRTLTLGEGATLTIQGTLLLNSVSGRPSSGEQDITGGYGRMILNGEAIVADGGQLDCFGYITGTGKVTVQNGGTASDMYIVRHWRGGTQAYNMYLENIYPMNEYDCRNIEVDVIIHYGGSYEGLVKMYAGNEYNYTRYPQVHVTNGLIRLTDEDGYVVRSYADGVETYKIYGGAEFANSALTIVGVDLTTAEFLYPIDGDIRFELYGGRYDFVNDYKFMPGSSVLVGSDASLYVAAGITVVFYQEFNDVPNVVGTQYPAGRAPAVLTVQAGGSFTNAGTFAGHIYTESPDIWIGVNPVWDAVTKEANGLAASLPDGVEAYVELQHALSMERPGHTWHHGQDLSIVWDGYADYSAVQQAIASIPKDLDYYTPESVDAIQPAVDAVIYNLPYERQTEVDAMAIPIQEAVAGLVPRTITVTLDPNGGTVEHTSFEATCTQTISTLPTPIREYYSFQGWYDADGNRVTDKTVVWYKEDLTLTAQWQILPADNTALVRARRKIPTDMSMYSEESVAAVRAAEAVANYNLTADRQAEVDAMAQAILDAIDNLAYTVTLDANGGEVTPDTLEKRRVETDYAGLPTPVRRGYRFDGWFNSEGIQVTAESTPTQGHHTLTAKWTEIPADYTAVDAALAQVPADLTVYTDETVAALQAAINGVIRDLMGDRQDDVDAMAQAILDAIAGLKIYTIQITFDPNGGTVAVTTMTVEYTKAYGELPVPEYPGHRFDGWFNAAGQQVTAETVADTKENVTLTAKWTEIPADYTAVDEALTQVPADLTIYSDETAAALQTAIDNVVRGLLADRQDDVDAMAQAILDAISDLELRTITVTLDPNGGTVDPATITVTCTKTFGTLPVPVYPGFDFAGWYTADGIRVDAATVVEARTDLTLTARWVENMADYTAVENAKAQIPADLSIYSDETVAALKAAVDAVDYTLTMDRQDKVDAMAQAILDAIAALEKKAVTVTTYDGNGNVVEMEVIYGEAIGELPVPKDDCKIFLGWYNAEGELVTEDTIIDSMEDMLLTAKWQDVCLEVNGEDHTVIVHYHDGDGVISHVDVIVDPSVTVDDMTLRIPVALPTTRDAAQAPLIHVEIPDGFKLRLEIPTETLHYGNVVMKDNSDGSLELKKESVVWDYGLSLLVTESEDLRVVENSISFPDVADGFWAKDSIDYMSARGYLIGKTNGTYGVEEIMDRKMMVLVLWRLAGSPAHSQTVSPFPDVTDTNSNYYDAIMWAYEMGITTGHGDGTFRPDTPITREQFATLMHRYAMLIDSDLATAENGSITDFTDCTEIDPKMYESIQWAMDTGLMNGHTDGTFEPDGETPRYQMSVVFARFLQAYCKAQGK